MRFSVYRHGARLTGVVATVAATLLGASLASPAQAFSGELSISTFNRPSTVEWGGTEYMAYADKETLGHVHVVKLNSDGTVRDEWTSDMTSTYYGTGPTIAVSNGALVVAWTDHDGNINLAEPVGPSGGFGCETEVNQTFWNKTIITGVPVSLQAGFTPYLTSEGDNGAGRLYLTWGDNLTFTMHVIRLVVPAPAHCTSAQDFSADEWMEIGTDTTYVGPAMVVTGYGTSSEHFWLMWAGNDSNHHLNIAEYNSNWARMSKGTETTHSTITDIGGANFIAQGTVVMAYCGTNNVPYAQRFTTTAGGAEVRLSSGSCNIDKNTVGDFTYYSGGVDAGYESTGPDMIYAWPEGAANDITWF